MTRNVFAPITIKCNISNLLVGPGSNILSFVSGRRVIMFLRGALTALYSPQFLLSRYELSGEIFSLTGFNWLSRQITLFFLHQVVQRVKCKTAGA